MANIVQQVRELTTSLQKVQAVQDNEKRKAPPTKDQADNSLHSHAGGGGGGDEDSGGAGHCFHRGNV